MSDVVIKVENLSKRYRLGVIGGATLRDDLQRLWARIRGKPDPLLKVDQSPETLAASRLPLPASPVPPANGDGYIWALKDVSFEVQRGEILGIIGRNGAGKSTLLKILSRITAPTSGEVKIRGRVASLLEVGTGFHPELTGRENIFLNGAILGMTKQEIRRKFDEIISFAEVERFIDTPVKRYSSGMYVRLAFAVAAHLEPEILIIDEVLAVGDSAFQKKCLGKMGDAANEGRTVLFVSHNMSAITSLCASTLLIDRGYVKQRGQTTSVVTSYLASDIADSREICLLDHPNRTRGHQEFLTKVMLDLDNGNFAYYGRPLKIILEYNFPYPIATPQFVISVHTSAGIRVFTLNSDYQQNNVPNSLQGQGRIECRINKLPLLPGTYCISLRLWQPGQKLDDIENVLSFQVEWLKRDIGQFNWDNGMGVVYVDANWRDESVAGRKEQLMPSSGMKQEHGP